MDRAKFDNVLAAARQVQDFLWGEAEHRSYLDDTWFNILEKRFRKLRQLNPSIPHAAVERRKRILQVAAVALAWLENLGGLGPQPDDISNSASSTSSEGS